MNIGELLLQAVERGASELHVTVGVPPTVRLDGLLVRLSETPLKPEDTRSLVEQVIEEKNLSLLQDKGEIDFSYSSP